MLLFRALVRILHHRTSTHFEGPDKEEDLEVRTLIASVAV